MRLLGDSVCREQPNSPEVWLPPPSRAERNPATAAGAALFLGMMIGMLLTFTHTFAVILPVGLLLIAAFAGTAKRASP